MQQVSTSLLDKPSRQAYSTSLLDKSSRQVYSTSLLDKSTRQVYSTSLLDKSTWQVFSTSLLYKSSRQVGYLKLLLPEALKVEVFFKFSGINFGTMRGTFGTSLSGSSSLITCKVLGNFCSLGQVQAVISDGLNFCSMILKGTSRGWPACSANLTSRILCQNSPPLLTLEVTPDDLAEFYFLLVIVMCWASWIEKVARASVKLGLDTIFFIYSNFLGFIKIKY